MASIVNASVRAIRYYEEQGLLRSGRTGRGHRVYDSDAVWRVRTIQQLYAAGLSSKTIRELDTCLGPRLLTPAQIDGLRAELKQLDAKATELGKARRRLAAIIDSSELVERGVTVAVALPGPTA
nr:MerR family transcriptional regulator [Frondihabitans sp. VKM Ac-2883]